MFCFMAISFMKKRNNYNFLYFCIFCLGHRAADRYARDCHYHGELVFKLGDKQTGNSHCSCISDHLPLWYLLFLLKEIMWMK